MCACCSFNYTHAPPQFIFSGVSCCPMYEPLLLLLIVSIVSVGSTRRFFEIVQVQIPSCLVNHRARTVLKISPRITVMLLRKRSNMLQLLLPH